jgi:hypothetical protein
MFPLPPLKLLSVVLVPSLLSVLGFLSAPHGGPNSPPVAAGDSYTIHGSAAIGSVLTNDFDPDGDPMSPDAYQSDVWARHLVRRHAVTGSGGVRRHGQNAGRNALRRIGWITYSLGLQRRPFRNVSCPPSAWCKALSVLLR